MENITFTIDKLTKETILEAAFVLSSSNSIFIDTNSLEFLKDKISILSELTNKEIGQWVCRIVTNIYPIRGLSFLLDIGALSIVLPELDECNRVEQNLKYHTDNVAGHCMKTCSCVKNSLPLRLAGLFHDLGKRDTYSKKGDNITFHNHHVFSKRQACRIMERWELPEELCREVSFLVENHMYHYSREWTDAAIRRFVTKFKINKENILGLHDIDIFELRKADRVSRGITPVTEKQTDFEARIKEFVTRSK